MECSFFSDSIFLTRKDQRVNSATPEEREKWKEWEREQQRETDRDISRDRVIERKKRRERKKREGRKDPSALDISLVVYLGGNLNLFVGSLKASQIGGKTVAKSTWGSHN